MARLLLLLAMFQWVTPDKMVCVRTCTGNKFVPVYLDQAMTTPIPNPFGVSRDGSYTIYAQTDKAACVSFEVR